jgi:acetolactate synthase I/III small subunit
MKHTLSVLVENKPGVLTRVAGLFARRGFNIDSLVVGQSEDPNLSRMTITIDGAEHPIDQVTKQLHKLINVVKIRDLDPEHMVARELALIKVNASSATRSEIVQIAEIFQGRVVDVDKRTLTVEMASSPAKLASLEEMLQPFGIIEVVRTGTVGIARG